MTQALCLINQYLIVIKRSEEKTTKQPKEEKTEISKKRKTERTKKINKQ